MNTTTLNVVSLDDGRIIKKGGGATPTPPSGGESGGIKLMYLNLAPMGGVPMAGVKDALGEFNPIAKTTFNNSPVIIPLATTSLDDERMVDAVALFIGVRTLLGVALTLQRVRLSWIQRFLDGRTCKSPRQNFTHLTKN